MIYRRTVKAFSLVMVAIGIAVLASTFANGGGPTSTGFVLGIAFLGVGAGRYWLARRMES